MKTFKCLEKYAGTYGNTRNVGYSYTGEVGTQGVREGALDDLCRQLTEAFNAAKKQQKAAPAVAPGGGVKQLAQFHANQSDAVKDARQKELNDQVVFLRKWLSRQGAWFAGDSGLNWPETLKLRVVYDFDLQKQGLTKIAIKNGGLLYGADGQPFDTSKCVTHFSGPGKAIYVMSASGVLHCDSHSVGHRHHSSLLAGAPVACAGEIEVAKGRITWLSNKSGHYLPGRENLLQVLAMLQYNDVDLSFPLTVLGQGAGDYASVEAFFENQMIDDENFGKAVAYGKYTSDAGAMILVGETPSSGGYKHGPQGDGHYSN